MQPKRKAAANVFMEQNVAQHDGGDEGAEQPAGMSPAPQAPPPPGMPFAAPAPPKQAAAFGAPPPQRQRGRKANRAAGWAEDLRGAPARKRADARPRDRLLVLAAGDRAAERLCGAYAASAARSR